MAENGLQDDMIECPLCMDPLGLDDINFYPCACRYQICRFCWHRIRTDENGLCPHCREPYSENPAEYTPPTQEQMAKLKSEKKQKNVEKRQKIIESRKNLASVRVVQKNLVFVIGLSPRLADPEILKKNEYFGKFGRIYKVVINNHTVYNGAQGPSVSAYVTYVRNEDASKAITAVNNAYIDGRYLKASFGTTKYCTSFLRGIQCSKPDCMYLHELGDNDASFTKEDMQLGKHQVYETATLAAANVPASFRDMQQQNPVVMGTTGGGVKIKHVAHNKPTLATDGAESALPATASWGSSVKSTAQVSSQSSPEGTAQQSSPKDGKTNLNPTLSHSHSVGTTTRHKHQLLHKSHSHSPSHSTTNVSHSRTSSKLASKDLSASHNQSRAKSRALSPSNSSESSTASKRQPAIRERGHNRSNSASKSTSSLSPKSTLSGSSSSGSLKHDVENEMEAKNVGRDISACVSSGEEPTLGREESEGDEIGANERGEEGAAERGLVRGGWCQIEDTTQNNSTMVVTQSESVEQSEMRETKVMASLGCEGEKEKEEKESLAVVEDLPLSEAPNVVPSSSQQKEQSEFGKMGDTEDSSIVKVIPSFVGAGQFGSLGVSWNTSLPQHSVDSEPTQQASNDSEDVATPTSSTHTEDDLGFDPWDVSQQGLADLMKSEQHQNQQHSSTAPAVGGMSLSNGIGNENRSSLLQEEFRALFPSANVSFEGSSKSAGAIPTTSTYVPSRLDSALSSTYRPLLGTSPMAPMTSSSTSAPGGSLSMFLGQHQPGFPSSSIKVHPRSLASATSQSVGSKLASSEWPDLGVSITSKSTLGQWLPATTNTADAFKKDSAMSGSAPNTSIASNSSSSSSSTLPPPPPGFTAKTTPMTTPITAPTFPATSVASSTSGTGAAAVSARAPGATLNNTVNHSMWTGSVGNVKGAVTGNHLLQSWANFINFSSLSPSQQQQLVRGSQIYQQLLIQQQYLIRQSLLIQSNPYYQAHQQALAQAQTTLRAQLQQNVLRQQQIAAAIMTVAGHKIASSAPSSGVPLIGGSSSTVGVGSTVGGNVGLPGCPSGATGVHQQTHTQHLVKMPFASSESTKVSNHRGVVEGIPAVSQVAHQRHMAQTLPPHVSLSKQQQNRTVSSSKTIPSKNSAGSDAGTHQPATTAAGGTERQTVRLKAK